MRQLDIDFDEARGADLRARAERWIAENPEAWRLFVRLAEDRATLGRRFSIEQLVQRVRWDWPGATEGGDGFRVNNSYRAYLARRLIEAVPACAGLIETRRVRC
jgi:hypothetical protein